MPFTYMLRCADGSYYVGSTWDLERRLNEHRSGEGARYTRSRRPVELVFAREFDRVDEAYRLEKQIQGWSRAKREALIDGRWNDLPALSRNRENRRRDADFDRLNQRGRYCRDVTRRVLVLNGPNLGRLGSREPDVYGDQDLDALRARLADAAAADVEIDLRQTDDEGELIGWLHAAVDAAEPVILNPAAFTHYSYALRDACALVSKAGISLVEVHISNPAARDAFRHTSVIGAVATGTIAGFGFDSYVLALRAVGCAA